MNVKVTPEFLAKSLAFRAGLVVMVVLAAMLALTFKAQTGMPFAKTTQVKAVINNVHSLRANDAVRENSKRIGRVSHVEYKDGAALITMELDGKVKVYKNAHAAIWDLSALATKFVELDRGSPSTGERGATPIPASQTQDSADLYQALDALDPKTRAAATQTLREIGGGVAGHGDDLQQFLDHAPADLTDIGKVSKSLSDPGTNLVGLLDKTDELAGRFKGRQDQLSALVKQTDQTLTATFVDSGKPLRESLQKLPDTLTHTKAAMDALNDPLAQTGEAMRDLEPGAQALGKSENDLRKFLRESVPVAHQVPGVAKQAVPAVENLTTTVADARPLAPRIRQAIGDLMEPLRVLAPYSIDMKNLFERGASFVSQGPNPGVRYARLGVTPGVNTLTGGIFPSSNLPQNQYPKPGEAQNDRATGLLPTGLLPGVN